MPRNPFISVLGGQPEQCCSDDQVLHVAIVLIRLIFILVPRDQMISIPVSFGVLLTIRRDIVVAHTCGMLLTIDSLHLLVVCQSYQLK